MSKAECERQRCRERAEEGREERGRNATRCRGEAGKERRAESERKGSQVVRAASHMH